jgi:hypothetical protein
MPITPYVEYLVVAGGGSSGSGLGNGAGAGGFKRATGYAVTAGSPITVTVGGGGAASAGGTTNGNQGSDSVFGTITSKGGAYGVYTGASSNGIMGGSGSGAGGGGGGGTTGGASDGTQGNKGGDMPNFDPWYFGVSGGGGALEQGQIAENAKCGDGGDGLADSISGSSVTYAGGAGAGAVQYGPSPGANDRTKGLGGAGGGGDGGTAGNAGVAGTANTGGAGGGGGYLNATRYASGAGGSGVVIVRYPDYYDAAASTTGSPTATTSGGYRIYKWTGSGSITF